MNYAVLNQLKNKFYFDVNDIADILNIKLGSAKVLCSRYTKNGVFTRLKKNFYVLSHRFETFSNDELMQISNFLQSPSYISFLTALAYYEVTTQVQRNFFENVSLKRTKAYNINGRVFNYYKLNKEYYFDFIKKDDIFIAIKEKAFMDSVYLYSLGKYKIDFSSLDLDKLDKNKIKSILKSYPNRTKNIVRKLCKI